MQAGRSFFQNGDTFGQLHVSVEAIAGRKRVAVRRARHVHPHARTADQLARIGSAGRFELGPYAVHLAERAVHFALRNVRRLVQLFFDLPDQFVTFAEKIVEHGLGWFGWREQQGLNRFGSF